MMAADDAAHGHASINSFVWPRRSAACEPYLHRAKLITAVGHSRGGQSIMSDAALDVSISLLELRGTATRSVDSKGVLLQYDAVGQVGIV